MTSKTTNRFSPEVHAWAVRMALDHEGEHPARWATMMSIAGKIGCTAQTLNEWVKKFEIDYARKPGLTTDITVRLKALERASSVNLHPHIYRIVMIQEAELRQRVLQSHVSL